jgi:hypothetical protein
MRLRLESVVEALCGIWRIGLAQQWAVAPIEHDVRVAYVQQLRDAALKRGSEQGAYTVRI